MKKKLILDSLSNHLGENNISLLGSWSLLGNEKNNISLPKDPFESGDKIFEISKLVNMVYEELFPQITKHLNTINKSENSNQFWQMMVGPWLFCIIEIIVEREHRLNDFIKESKDSFDVDLIELKGISFANTNDFLINGYENVQFHHWILSQILKNKYPSAFNISGTKVSTLLKRKVSYDRKSIKFKLKFFLKNLLGVQSVKGISFLESFLLSVSIPRNKRKIPRNIELDIVKNAAPRCSQDWQLDLVLSTLPKCFEHVKGLKRFCFKIPYQFKLVSGTLLYTEEEYKYSLANYRDRGGKIIPVQHGSNYGYLRSFPWNNKFEYSLGDFITWGWSHHEGYIGRFHALPSPLISKLIKRSINPKNNFDKIIFVGTKMTPLTGLLASVVSANRTLEYRKDKLVFVKNLNEIIKKKILYRPYTSSLSQFKDKSYIMENNDSIKICEGDFEQHLIESKLVICDHLGTTFHLTMGANIPSICFWNKDDWGFTDEFYDLLKPLESVGIVHFTPESAADFINLKENGLQEWWQSSDVQRAKNSWCQSYALSSTNYVFEWKNFIKNLSI